MNIARINIPEVGDDLVTTICGLFVLLRGALGDLEPVGGEHCVAGVCAAANLTAVQAMAEDLRTLSAHCCSTDTRSTHAGLAVAVHLVADVAAHASSGRHLGLRRLERVDWSEIDNGLECGRFDDLEEYNPTRTAVLYLASTPRC